MKRLILITCLILSLIPAGIVMATADVSNAIYRAPITITNTGTAATAVSCNVTISTPNLISGGFANSTVSNVAILTSGGADAPFMPGYTTSPWMVFTPSMAATSSQSMTLYTDNSSNGKLSYFPATTGMTQTDNMTEYGATFIRTDIGYLDTTVTTGVYAEKPSAFKLYNSASGNVTAQIYTYDYLYPDGDDTIGIGGVTGSGTHWDAVNDVYSTPDDSATTVNQTGVGWEYDIYTLTDPTFSDNLTIDSVTLFARNYANPLGSNYNLFTSLGGVEASVGTSSIPGTGVWTTVSHTATTDPNGAAWTKANLTNLKVKLGLNANNPKCTQFYVRVNLRLVTTLAGVSSGEKTITTSLSGGLLSVGVTGYTTATNFSAGVAVPDNTGTWTYLTNYIMPYMYEQDVNISGVTKQHIHWAYGTVFPDLSLNGNATIPSFRTTASDPDVTAALGAFTIVSPAASGASPVPGSTDNWTSTDNGTSSFSTTITPTMPGATIISAISTASGTPAQLPFTWISGLIILIISLSLSHFLRANNTVSLTTKMGLIFLCMLVAVVTSIYDAWMIIMWLPLAIALAMGSKQYGW
jgi:hypothetical protein